jgi:2-hydroxy-3-oxopropionate reductase
MKLGFIGLGIMGSPRALHLIADGHQLFVNTVGPLPEAIAGSSAQACAHAAEVTRHADIVIDGPPG